MSTGLAYIISQVSQSNVFEWTISRLDRKKYRLVFILMHKESTPFEEFLRKEGFTVYRLHYRSKYNILSCFFSIRKILKKEKIAIVHTHMFEGGLAGIIAARSAGVPKRIHTRHDATFHHQYHPQAVKYDKLTNRYATHIIAITKNVKNILINLESVPPEKVTIIHHGFKMDEFTEPDEARTEALRKKYFGEERSYPVIGVVSRFIEWKGIEYIIAAFSELLVKYPSAKLVLANAQGPDANKIEKKLSMIPPSSYTRIPFEKDVIALYRLFDFFVHVPVDESAEAFGQVYIEAMAAGVPSVVTLSGIAPDFVLDRINGMVVSYRDAAAIANRIEELMTNELLRTAIITKAKSTVIAEFPVEKTIRQLENLYDA